VLLGYSSPAFAHADEPPVRFETISKPGGVRLIARLSGPIAAEYLDAVTAVVPRIEQKLSRAVVAERVVLRRPTAHGHPRIVATDLPTARASARARATRLVRVRPGPVILADVRSCYASVAPAVVERQLRLLGCAEDAPSVRAVLERLSELGVRGLPVGPRASAVLANAALARVDEEIADAGALHLRWVDDLAVFPGDRDPEPVLGRVAEALHHLGLSLATEKCAIGTLEATRFGRSLLRRAPAPPHLGASLG
jgi:hypothetical protein